MAVDVSAVGRPVPWLDSVFEDAEHSSLSYQTEPNNITSLDELFEERAAVDQSEANGGYHRQQLVVSSTASADQVHFYTGSTRSSSGGSPVRAQSNSRKTSHSSHGSYSSPSEVSRNAKTGVECDDHPVFSPTEVNNHSSFPNLPKESKIKKWKRRFSEGFLRISHSPSPIETSPNSMQPTTSSAATSTRNKLTQRPKSLAISPTDVLPKHRSSVSVPSSTYDTVDSSCSAHPPSKPFGSCNSLSRRRYSESSSLFGRLEAYKKLEQLGEGSYATVYKGISIVNGHSVAMKEIRLNVEEGTPFTAIREASLLKGLKHVNIVRLHDIVHTSSNLTFVFEYVDTDLSHYMEQNPGPLDPHNVQLFMFQLLRGLAVCHKKKILHRDLKPQNLLISKNGELKLADFGLARAKSVPTRTYSHEVVTLWYRPPDVLMGSTEYSTPLDMWGVGCIFVEMLTGKPLFPGIKGVYDQLNKIWNVLGTPNELTWPGVSSFPDYKPYHFRKCEPKQLEIVSPILSTSLRAGDLATNIIRLIPSERLSANEVISHKYFSTLPEGVHSISDSTSIYVVPGVTYHR